MAEESIPRIIDKIRGLTEAVDWEIREVDQAVKAIRRHLKRIERQLEGEQ
jgi:hypothetical protein